MSDRLPPRRRSGGGKHVATRRAGRPLTGLAHAGVATAMVAGLALVVVNPAAGVAAAGPSADVAVTVAGPADHAAALAAQRDWLAARDATRQDIAGVATQAVAQVADVRAKAAQANVPADQLAALDALEQRVDQLVAQVRDSTVVRVSRSGDRVSDEPTVAPGGPAAAPSATMPAAPTPTPALPAASETSTAPAPDPSDVGGGDSAATGAATGSANVASDVGADAGAEDATPDVAVAAPAADVTDPAALDAALPAVTAADDPTAAALRDALVALAQQVSQVDAAADAATAQAAAAAAEAAVRASLARYANGRIPASALCAPSFDTSALLRCDAAAALDRLDVAYLAAFGSHLTVTDSYRSYAAQVLCRRQKGNLCAVPGTSNHGLGVAVDFGGPAHTSGTTAHDWLLAHAAEYGWHLPGWAQARGSKPEPWHWEYVG